MIVGKWSQGFVHSRSGAVTASLNGRLPALTADLTAVMSGNDRFTPLCGDKEGDKAKEASVEEEDMQRTTKSGKHITPELLFEAIALTVEEPTLEELDETILWALLLVRALHAQSVTKQHTCTKTKRVSGFQPIRIVGCA